jgi:valyl-tRNA synthetase
MWTQRNWQCPLSQQLNLAKYVLRQTIGKILILVGWKTSSLGVFEENEAAAQAAANEFHGKVVAITQETDVLDTWFSSGLWPFSTMGWPEETPELARFYPTTTLVTMFDIIFFWVARMMMMGIHFTGSPPFKNIIIHSRVVDEFGKKMSKSKGNIIDPVPLIDTYGADALRFSLAIAAGPGRDIRMSSKRVEGYRNFATKLWNAARFCQMNECAFGPEYSPNDAKNTLNKWIISQVWRADKNIRSGLENHRFDEAANAIYSLIWAVFCDWYLELIKPILNGEDEAAKAETRATAAWALDQILKFLHPFMPFITEELWEKTAEFNAKRDGLLIAESWPVLDKSLQDETAESDISWVIDIISGIRSLRAETNIPAGAKIPAILVGANQESRNLLERYQDEIDRLARLDYSTSADHMPKGAVSFVLDEAIVALPLTGILDVDAERARLNKEILRCDGEAAKINAKLGNDNFVSRAPEEVIDEQRRRLADYENEKLKYQNALAKLDEI